MYVPAVLTLIALPVPVNPPGPDHEYVYGPVPPAPTAVRLAGSAEAHAATGATVTVGFGFNVKTPEPVPVQCVLLLSVTVTLYVPAVLTLIGFPVAVNPPGPDHENVYGPVPPEPTAVRLVGTADAQTVTGATVTVGFGFTVTVVLHDVPHTPPAPAVMSTARLKLPAAPASTTTEDPVAEPLIVPLPVIDQR